MSSRLLNAAARRRRRHGLLAGIALGIAGWLALHPAAALEDDLGLPWLYALRGPVAAPGEVVVVALDEPSAQALGLPDKPRSWPRALHAELVRELARAGAAIVAFDLAFDTPSADPLQDAALAAAIRDAGNVLLVETLREDAAPLHAPDGSLLANLRVETRLRSLPALHQAALGSAPFVLPRLARVDWYWTFRADGGDVVALPVLAFHAWAADALAVLRGEFGLRGATLRDTVETLRERLASDAAARERLSNQLRAQPHARTLAEIDGGDDVRYLNYYGPPRTIRTLPYASLIEAARGGAGAPDAGLRGRAVFVGYSPASPGAQDSLRDAYRTVYTRPDGLELSGVEIAATAFANLLDRRYLQPLTMPAQAALAFALGALWGALAAAPRVRLALAAQLALGAAWLAAAALGFAAAALWLPVAVPLAVQLPLALAATVVFAYRRARREREAIRHAFGKFLPPSIVERLSERIASPAELDRVGYGACLASDAASYTPLAETLPPAALGALMNGYYARLFAPVEECGGSVVDVVGDAMVAVWADPGGDPAALRRAACRAALRIVAAPPQRAEGGVAAVQLATRIGLHAGDMMVGSVGASRHFEFRAIGDVINTATRIDGLNKLLGTRVLATAETVEGLDELGTRPLGSFLLAGKRSPIRVVELLERRDEALCAGFAEALAHWRERRWPQAREGFAELLRRYPDDGPSRYYLHSCKTLEHAPPGDAWSPTIRLESK